MSDSTDDFVRLGRPLSIPRRIPTTAHTMVCKEIAPERQIEGAAKFELSLAERWSSLTLPLPLAGAEALRPDANGRLPAIEALRAASPWLEPILKHLELQLRVQLAIGRPWVAFEPLLLVGPPGTGKTWLVRRIAEALGLPSGVLEMGAASDDRTLAGTARGYNQTQPAWPLVEIAQSEVANPVLALDEIEKAGGSARNGRPHFTLLGMIETTSAKAWYDGCLLAECDLSHVNWIACANDVAPIPTPLLSRFHVFELSPPQPDHFDAALASIVRDIAMRWEWPINMMPALPPTAVSVLRDQFSRSRSIRRLARDARALLGAALVDRGGATRQ